MTEKGNIDEYILGFPPEIREKLEIIRHTVREAAPGAREIISYGMPAFRQNRILCYFASFKNHISFFPSSSGVEAFKSELTGYKHSRGTIQIPHSMPVPVELITRIVQFRVAEDLEKKKKKG